MLQQWFLNCHLTPLICQEVASILAKLECDSVIILRVACH